MNFSLCDACCTIPAVMTRLRSVMAVLCVALVSLSAAAAGKDEPEVVEAVDTVTASSLFLSMPSSLAEMLDTGTRFELVTLWQSGKKADKINNLYSLTTLDTLSTDYLKVQLTESAMLTINLMDGPETKKPVVVTIYTVGTKEGAADSEISFFDTEWKPLDQKKFWKPLRLDDFLLRPSGSDMDIKEIRSLIPFPTYQLETSQDGRTVTATLTVGRYLSDEDREKIEPFVILERKFRWDGHRYRLEPLNKTK